MTNNKKKGKKKKKRGGVCFLYRKIPGDKMELFPAITTSSVFCKA